MAMPHGPAGTSLSWEQMMNIMVPKERCKFTFAEVADDFGPTKTHTFDPPYDMTVGCGYSVWVSADGVPQLWLVEQREDLGFYFVREARRVQASDLH